jgi:hypothetical protein
VADGNASPSADVVGSLAYLVAAGDDACYRVYPPSSGRPAYSPAMHRFDMPITDCRPLQRDLRLDREGFELHAHASTFGDVLDARRVESDYYPEMGQWLRRLVGAETVVVFDHNVRSAAGAAADRSGCARRSTRCTTTTPRRPVPGAPPSCSTRTGWAI